MHQYYILIDNEQRGPFTFEQLRSQSVTAKTLVWRDGLGEWAPAENVADLRSLLNPYLSPLASEVAALFPPPPLSPRRMKHSGPGIASFVLGLLTGIGAFVIFVIAGVIGMQHPEGVDETDPAIIMVGFGIIFAVLSALVGLGLGAAGLFQSDRYKLFPVLGLIVNLAVIMGIGGLMVLGMAAGG